MADRIDIPAALRDEIAADLEAGGDRAKRWRPDVAQGDDVLALAFPPGDPDLDDDPRWGQIGGVYSVRHEYRDASWEDEPEYGLIAVTVSTPDQKHHPRASDLDAWAPVGGVDGGPRPDIGDRVMIVEILGGYDDPGQVGTVRMIDEILGRIGVDLDGGGSAYATRWAILPPCLKTDSEPSHQVADGVPPGAGDDEPEAPAEVHALRADLDQALDVVTGLAQIIGPDQPVDPLTANPDHTWPCADYCCTRGCPGIGNTLHGPPWPCDATRCTCGNTVIRAVAHDRQRLARILTDLTAWLTAETQRLRDAGLTSTHVNGNLDLARSTATRRVLDRLRDQGLDVDYFAEPDTREQT